MISLFVHLDLDMLVLASTVPHNSYRNPVERVMSSLNLGLQAVGMMRQKMLEEFERLIHCCNSMKEIRAAVSKNPSLEGAFNDSLQPTMCLLTEVITRLNLKEEPVLVQTPSNKEEITSLGKCIHEIDPTIQITDTRKEPLKSHKQLQDYMKHCCVQRQYFFCIKKCGVQGCKICKPPRLPSIVCANSASSLIR